MIFCEINGELACRLMYIGKLRKNTCQQFKWFWFYSDRLRKWCKISQQSIVVENQSKLNCLQYKGFILMILALLLGRVILILQSGWTRWASKKITLYWNNTMNRSKSKYFCFLIWFLLLLLLLSAILTSSR